MLSTAELKSQILSLVEIVLQNSTSAENRVLLVSKIERMDFSPGAVQHSLERIRMGVSLLVSEELAEDIYEELTALVSKTSQDTPPPFE